MLNQLSRTEKSVTFEGKIKVWKNPQGNIVLQIGDNEIFTSFSNKEGSKRNHNHLYTQLEKLLGETPGGKNHVKSN